MGGKWWKQNLYVWFSKNKTIDSEEIRLLVFIVGTILNNADDCSIIWQVPSLDCSTPLQRYSVCLGG